MREMLPGNQGGYLTTGIFLACNFGNWRFMSKGPSNPFLSTRIIPHLQIECSIAVPGLIPSFTHSVVFHPVS